MPAHAGIANGLFLAATLAMQVQHGHVMLGGCCKVLLITLCGTVASKLTLEGPKSIPDYSGHGQRAAGESWSGLSCFLTAAETALLAHAAICSAACRLGS